MTISMPSGLKLVQSVPPSLLRSVQNTPLRGGGGLSIEYAPSRWTVDIETPAALDREDVDPILAFVDSLKGGLETVYMGDWLRKYPITYPSGFSGLTRAAGGSFDGTATVTSISASTVTVGTLPASFALKAGDMVGLSQGSYRSMHRVVANATANGSGSATLTVEPAISTSHFTTSATANFASPVCVMKLNGDVKRTRDVRRETVSFSLVQVPF